MRRASCVHTMSVLWRRVTDELALMPLIWMARFKCTLYAPRKESGSICIGTHTMPIPPLHSYSAEPELCEERMFDSPCDWPRDELDVNQEARRFVKKIDRATSHFPPTLEIPM